MVDWEITGTSIKDSWHRTRQAGDNGMKNNSTPFDVAEYDRQIKGTLPFYEEMFQQVVDIVRILNLQLLRWLDVGCGTLRKYLIMMEKGSANYFIKECLMNMFSRNMKMPENFLN